jgi:DNA-binding CsgD family transcriptional regulator
MIAQSIPQMHQSVLSTREMEIAHLLAWGFSDKEIASKLFLSAHTVRTHHGNINQKTNSRNLADVARWYFQTIQATSFGNRPSLGRVMAVILFLLLIGVSEIMYTQMIRTRASRIAKVRAKRGRRNDVYILT